MKTVIKSIHLENFKGCKDGTYLIGSNATIFGQNGAGKTTIGTAFYWLFSDKDFGLHSNPAIRPIGAEEVTPRVEVVLDVDGREVTVAKFQKCTIKKSKTDGVDTVSLSNSYEVNAVEYGERDFKAKLGEYGIDFDLFLPLSHPDVFTGQKAAEMRKVLFSMASDKSDYEIAQLTEGASDVLELLANYTMEEIKAMQSATLRKFREDYGKDGEILRAKIEGLEMSKSDIDVAELEIGKKAVYELIKSNKEKQDDISKQYEEQQKLSDGIMELKFAQSDLQRQAFSKVERKRNELYSQLETARISYNAACRDKQSAEEQIKSATNAVECAEKELATVRDTWKSLNAMQFDESEEICQMCGQRLPQDKIDVLKSEFDERKKKSLADVTERGNRLKSTVVGEKDRIEKLKRTVEESEKSMALYEKKTADLQLELDVLPTSVDVSDTDEYMALQKQIDEKEKTMQTSSNADEIRQSLKNEESELQERLTAIEKRIAVAGRNVEIDEQIAELREKQKSYEQQKADCEKILDQLDSVSKKKNELLTEDINKNFDIVRWQMFEYQKNGEYKECCVPRIDDKRFGESTNTGREVLAKLDIIKGLQKFYGQYYPVFLDGAECLSEKTKKRINMDCQIIFLAVSEDKELIIAEVN